MIVTLALDLPPGTVLTDPVPPLLDLLVTVGVWAALVLALVWLRLVWWRERMIRKVARAHPESADQLRAAARSISLFARPAPAPADPSALTHRIVVAPLGDGRPGESFRAPGPDVGFSDLGVDGSRQDARVLIAERTHLLVVCLGRVGRLSGGEEIRPAAERVHRVREGYVAPQAAIGPVDRVDCALGVAWRTTCTYGGAAVLTDTHVDHDGWAFVVGVLSYAWHARAVEALDRVLATWQWIPDEGPGVG
ncbi:hypothetical protein [Cellulomonas sp. ICMP 17802]|uniref:hypothetical protein n=1 Tax=Cellulomonas sp. ICMP 17802 TaxID=3239199 RepID=UPI00351ADB0A